MRDLGQDVAHEVDLAALPGGTQPFFLHGGLDAPAGVRDTEADPMKAAPLELSEKRPPAVLGFVEHGLDGQDLPGSGLIYAVGDHQGHRNDLPVHPDLVVERIDPEEGIFLLQGAVSEGIGLDREFLVDVRDLAGRDVLDAHGLGQPFDLPGADAVDEGFLDDGDQRLFGSPPFRDKEGHVAALAQFRNQKIDRSQAGIHPSDPGPREEGRSFPAVGALFGSDFRFRFDSHHLIGYPPEHGQDGIRFADTPQ
jgi:hypothetical protein